MKYLKGKKILLTAGPTFEPIDPVRFIGNRSSGKMGYAIAKSLADAECDVVLVSGPVHIELKHDKVSIIKVQTAEEMHNAVHENFASCDIAILSAAVADYTVAKPAKQKIKKQTDQDKLVLELVRTKDILKSLGEVKKDKILVGFALETNNELENAKKKLKKKNLDFIVLNSLQDKGAGFQHDTNKITIVNSHNKITKFELKSKQKVADDIASYLNNWLKEQNS